MIVSIKNYVHLISYLKVRDLARSWGFALQETLLDAVFGRVTGSSEIKELAYNVEVIRLTFKLACLVFNLLSRSSVSIRAIASMAM